LIANNPPPVMTPDLAVIIPTYKTQYLGAALQSLAAQTAKGFRVYIGDDASMHDVLSVVRRYEKQLDLVYHRFSDNLGAMSLAGQWNRCIRLSGEPWVWLFADDDTTDSGCVEAWRDVRSNPSTCPDVFRFNTRTIGAAGEILSWNPPHPEWESAIHFAYHRLSLNRRSYACEYVFSREAFENLGGMVELPLAWCSDDASWISMGRKTGIRTVHGPCVNWRFSGSNLSSVNRKTRQVKVDALIAYGAWLRAEFEGRASDVSGLGWARLQPRAPAWFRHECMVAGCWPTPARLRSFRRAVGAEPVAWREEVRACAVDGLRIWSQRLRKCVIHGAGRKANN
jgi:glycosyltransferase involved in cell wall biosynthesis